MDGSLTDRDGRILTAVIREYIRDGEPVSSRKIARKYGFNLSPATIRNVMADLEDQGFLYQPHTSAGRMPTQSGFRFYVDVICENPELPQQEMDAIRKKYQKASPDLNGLLQETSKILSDFSHVAGVVFAPAIIDTVFKRIDFILLKKGHILAVFVSQVGLVQNKVLRIDDKAITQDDLNKSSRYLNSILSGLTLREVRQKIVEEMKKEQTTYSELLSSALEMGNSTFADEAEYEIYVQGQANFLEYQEFSTIDKLKVILRTFEEKSMLVRILDRALEKEGVRIFIGAENELPEMEDCSFILSPYTGDNAVLGSLGVVGPTRMNYFHIIPVVNYIARVVSARLNEEYIEG